MLPPPHAGGSDAIHEADEAIQQIADALRSAVEDAVDHGFDKFVARHYRRRAAGDGTDYYLEIDHGPENLHVLVHQDAAGAYTLVSVTEHHPYGGTLDPFPR